MAIWISVDEALRLGRGRSLLFEQIKPGGKLTTRIIGKSRNGKSKREIDLSSLPGKIQARYFAPPQGGQSDGENQKRVNPFPLPAGGVSNSFTSPVGSPARILSGDELEKLTPIAEVLREVIAAGNTKGSKEAAATKLAAIVPAIDPVTSLSVFASAALTSTSAAELESTVQEAKKIVSLAAAAQVYARQEKLSDEAKRYAKEIELRAKRKLGQILRMMIKNKGGYPEQSTGTKTEPVLDFIVNLPTYKDIKLDKKLASGHYSSGGFPSGKSASALIRH
jgi:hypothetical protein